MLLRLLSAGLLLVGLGQAATAQQDEQYSQFTHDKLTYNPAYAGAKGGTTVSAIARMQWAGFEGAPHSQALRAHIPLEYSRVGLGVSIGNDVIGYQRSTYVKGAYSYRLPLDNGLFLNIGFDAQLRQVRTDYTEARRNDAIDNVLGRVPVSTRLLPNFGGGAFLYSRAFYVGASIPRVISGLTFLSETVGGGVTANAREVRHFSLMGGVSFPLTDDVDIRPAAHAKIVTNAPPSIDVNVMGVFYESIAVGAAYRGGGLNNPLQTAAADLIVQVMPTERMTIGTAYGHPISKLTGRNAGSFEVLFEYTWVRRPGIKCFYF